ncbi:MAG: tRNA pseudouridine(55) synthase TruB [Legionella sp.]|nr:tRNA pseudouridine(55) synthase TruB [Legionella sp.]
MSKVECNLPVNGILLVNKPQGLSSNAVLQKVKRLYKAKKAGHTGSLDPLATGMLPVCFGEATKICQYLLDADKHYEATGLLGIKTNTGDSLGEIINQIDNFTISEAQLLTVINQFIGLTQQVPSMFSALKHHGKPLYKLAREGITVDRKARDIMIDVIKLLRFDGRQFEISVSCSKGTYIRNLVEDIGEKLGVYAHVTQLHRVHTTGFIDERMYSLDELTSKNSEELLNCLLPLERAIDYMPVLQINDDEVIQLQQGKTLQYEHEQAVSCIRLRDMMDNFIGLGEVTDDGVLKVKRLLATD